MTDLAEAFDRMAMRIRAGEESDFNGAMVVVGPDGTVIELLLQGTRDEIVFWSVAATKVEATSKEMAMKATQPQGFGGRY